MHILKATHIAILSVIVASAAIPRNVSFNMGTAGFNDGLCVVQQTDTLSLLWDSFINSKACIGGFQYVNHRDRPMPKSLAFARDDWARFASKDPQILTNFLIAKFADTTTTTLHVCPFFQAKTGELAVYALQQIHQVNWFDFEFFRKYNRDYASATEQPQIWLREVLGHKGKRKKLEQLFIAQLKK